MNSETTKCHHSPDCERCPLGTFAVKYPDKRSGLFVQPVRCPARGHEGFGGLWVSPESDRIQDQLKILGDVVGIELDNDGAKTLHAFLGRFIQQIEQET